MLEYINKFERGVYYVLMVLLAIVIIFTLIGLIISLIPSLATANVMFRLGNAEILEIFGYFLLVLIGIELLETIKAYLIKNEIHVEIIILVAIIAVARKIILLDPFIEGTEALNSTVMIALGVVVIALSASYFLIRKTGISL
ncbi:MAG: phosphate-starvation-inducible PsiE family protein [Methanoregulaceae archaeon]|nr:phosphate-starvation-inducible PsiE family protein [Methanoregulaceae archaeon]